jgi:6-pyruvoyltetrahydropterin/6-carboxytetrahydropterin synthase
MTILLRRRAGFSAGCAGPAVPRGGHNYMCELAVAGSIDPTTGMVVNIKDVDAVLKAKVVGPLAGRLLDQDVPAFRDTPPTAVNLARWIALACAPDLPAACRLARVTLWETPTSWAEARPGREGGDFDMLTMTRAYDFAASHRLHSAALSAAENADLFGKCNWVNGHGHNYMVEVTLSGTPDPASGELFPPAELDRIVEEEVLKPYDHRHLNYDAPEFAELNPTSENVTRVIWEKLAPRLSRGRTRLHRVVLRETERNYFEYHGETSD